MNGSTALWQTRVRQYAYATGRTIIVHTVTYANNGAAYTTSTLHTANAAEPETELAVFVPPRRRPAPPPSYRAPSPRPRLLERRFIRAPAQRFAHRP